MHPRRRFLRLALGGLSAAALSVARAQTDSVAPMIWLPLVRNAPPPPPPPPTPTPTPDDLPIVGLPTGLAEQAHAWLIARAAAEYTAYDTWAIINAYQQIGDSVELDWFMAIAQMCHETGSMTSWWAARPRRNPAGIGVTGRIQVGTPDAPPGPAWAWDGSVWREGVSFASWVEHGIPAHLGRLLAYALRDDQASPAQFALIQRALAVRPLPLYLRGSSPTYISLNGRWAVPGTSYGQRIIDLARRMRG
ncbi:MAG: glucosaminidase domain-containing protein [Roseiflexaceae bacterium]